ncbi:unnamed protein product [Schistocephalus solidus]|uniref:Uncharacterized protein n=1 Tax=Schistocephalus solidus TaxID=70667 RepID=A0A183T7X7_SCHSO|nr:unnamed protein product [Schistocephalus solidus]
MILPSGHTPGNRHERPAKRSEGLRCCPTTLPFYFSSSTSSLPSFILSFNLTSTPPLLPLSSPFPPHPPS